MNKPLLSEEDVCDAVITYFKGNEFTDWTVDTECSIQFGAGKHKIYGIADVVLKGKAGHWAAIVECKSEKEGDSEKARDQLKSYLSATDTRFGILAFSANPNDWIYCENLRSNVFRVKEKSVFEQQFADPPALDKHRSNILVFVLTIGLLIAIGISVYQVIPKDTSYQVIRIVDGDTFEIEYKGKRTSVQLIGVNAPEPNKTNNRPPEPYSEAAIKYLRDLLLEQLVYFIFDESKFDKYDRLLAYTYRSSDGVFVNLELIREGYAEVDLRYPFKYKGLFMDYESRAKSDRKGLWGSRIR